MEKTAIGSDSQLNDYNPEQELFKSSEPKYFLSSNFFSNNIITIGSFLIIVVGIFKLNYFYSEFGINILDYIQVTEIFSLYLIEAISLTIFFLLQSYIIYILQQIESNLSKRKIEIQQAPVSNKLILAYLIMTIIFLAYRWYFYYADYEKYITGRNIFIVPLFILIVSVLAKFKIQELIRKDVFLNLMLTSFIVLFTTVFFTDRKIADLKFKNSRQIYSFEYNKSSIKTGREKSYIGQTSKYIFIYDRMQKTAYIYDKEHVLNLEIKYLK